MVSEVRIAGPTLARIIFVYASKTIVPLDNAPELFVASGSNSQSIVAELEHARSESVLVVAISC